MEAYKIAQRKPTGLIYGILFTVFTLLRQYLRYYTQQYKKNCSQKRLHDKSGAYVMLAADQLAVNQTTRHRITNVFKYTQLTGNIVQVSRASEKRWNEEHL